MSTSSIRRIKERGGAGCKITAMKSSRSVTPISDKTSIGGGGGVEVLKKSTGKENPRPGSRVLAGSSQKPVIRAMPRIEKPVPEGAEPRVRRSTPSVPRGRSSSPSDFTRMLSDLRKQRGDLRGSVDRSEKGLVGENGASGLSGGKGFSGTRVLEKVQPKKNLKDPNAKVTEGGLNGTRVLRKSKDSVFSAVNSVKDSEHKKGSVLKPKAEQNEECVKDVRVLGDCIEAKVRLGLENLGEAGQNSGLRFSKEGGALGLVVKAQKSASVKEESGEESCFVPKPNCTVEKLADGADVGQLEKSLDELNISDDLKVKGLNGEGVGVRASNKYPSNLHQKLAFLEGKVARIASDIKRTKEMLDMNNPNESKVVLSDIQERISGIEKAMGHDRTKSDGTSDFVKIVENDHGQEQVIGKGQNKPSENLKGSIKGMDSEELEARLLPHHKLLRYRTSLKASSDLSHQRLSLVSGSEPKVQDMSVSSLDGNPVALEFLASLSKEQSKVSTRDGHAVLDFGEVQEMDMTGTSEIQGASNMFNGKHDAEVVLTTNEAIDEFNCQENSQEMFIDDETEDAPAYELNEIGRKSSTGGWFVSEGESVLLAHDDGSCSFYDIANSEEKTVYKPPGGVSPNVWRDCWIIRAPGADGCSGRYIVAASAGNTMDSGFCSWDFYTKDVQALHIEDATTTSRTVLGPLHNNIGYRRNPLSTMMSPVNQQWWYKPAGPLIVSTASSQRVVRVYDIRDGEQIMKWDVQRPVLAMDYSSPLQWRNRGKVVIAESEAITLCDVSSLTPQPLLSISSGGRKISALHVNNTDAELGGGVRQRVSSSEAEGNDGVFCTPDTINVMDFRNPSGIGLKIPKVGVNAQSVFSRGDSIYLGCSNLRSAGKKHANSQVQHFSVRKQRLLNTYPLPESNAHFHYTAMTQVWGNSNLVMGVCGLGLFVFDALKDDVLQSFTIDSVKTQKVREVIGPDDLYSPSFDYSSSRALLISRDRPALWRHLS